MSSRLLSGLETRIATTRDPVRNACLRAERATLLARQGLLDQARAELDLIRARHAAAPDPVVTAWVCLGEGMVAHFSSMSTSARDRMLRALALSEAAGAKDVSALSAAWLSHMDYAGLQFSPMIRHLSHALAVSAPENHSARARAFLVLASALHWAERFDLAIPWYTRARAHSTAEGDDSMLSALMHNMAWLHVAAYRRREIIAPLAEAETRHAKTGADSVSSFDGLVGIASLRPLVPMLRAQVLVLEKQYAAALELMEAHAEQFIHQGLQRLACSVNADIAWCRFNCKDFAGALQYANSAVASLLPTSHFDDQAITHARASLIYRALGMDSPASYHEASAQVAWQQHQRRQDQLIESLDDLLQRLKVQLLQEASTQGCQTDGIL
jgi:tetratricopeptide (TPR) repeat protein